MSAWIVVLGSHERYHSSACWIFDDKETAERFATFVTQEIDPAQVLEARSPAAELLTWRDQVESYTTRAAAP